MLMPMPRPSHFHRAFQATEWRLSIVFVFAWVVASINSFDVFVIHIHMHYSYAGAWLAGTHVGRGAQLAELRKCVIHYSDNILAVTPRPHQFSDPLRLHNLNWTFEQCKRVLSSLQRWKRSTRSGCWATSSGSSRRRAPGRSRECPKSSSSRASSCSPTRVSIHYICFCTNSSSPLPPCPIFDVAMPTANAHMS